MWAILGITVNDKKEQQGFARAFAELGLQPTIRIAEKWEKEEQGGYQIPYVRTGPHHVDDHSRSIGHLMAEIEDHPDSYGPRIEPNPLQSGDPRLQAFYDRWWRLNSVSFAILPTDKDKVVKLFITRVLGLPTEVAEGFCAGGDAYCMTVGERQGNLVGFEPGLTAFWIGVMRLFPLDIQDIDIGFLAAQGPDLVRQFLSYLNTWHTPALDRLAANAVAWT